jgi:hypothetical protein
MESSIEGVEALCVGGVGCCKLMKSNSYDYSASGVGGDERRGEIARTSAQNANFA